MMKVKRATLLIIMVFFLLSCQTIGVKPWTEWQPKEKASWFMSIYNAQYDDYLIQAKRSDLSESEKEVLRVKKKVLQNVYPLIELYSVKAGSGEWDMAVLESQIMIYITRLTEVI